MSEAFKIPCNHDGMKNKEKTGVAPQESTQEILEHAKRILMSMGIKEKLADNKLTNAERVSLAKLDSFEQAYLMSAIKLLMAQKSEIGFTMRVNTLLKDVTGKSFEELKHVEVELPDGRVRIAGDLFIEAQTTLVRLVGISPDEKKSKVFEDTNPKYSTKSIRKNESQSEYFHVGLAGEIMQSNSKLAADVKKLKISSLDIAQTLSSVADFNTALVKKFQAAGLKSNPDGEKLLLQAAKNVQYNPETKIATFMLMGEKIEIPLNMLIEAKIDRKMAKSMKNELQHGI